MCQIAPSISQFGMDLILVFAKKCILNGEHFHNVVSVVSVVSLKVYKLWKILIFFEQSSECVSKACATILHASDCTLPL